MAIGLKKRNNVRPQAAFTLIELILVMTIMMVIVGIAAPSLKGFFKGRNLDNEAVRFLAVTRYGQSRAINEGIPVELWVNAKGGAYGLEAVSGYTETEKKQQQYNLSPGVMIELSKPPTLTATATTHSNYWMQTKAQVGNTTRIRFQPDGFISDMSPQNIYLRQEDRSQITIAEAPTHMGYVIKPAQP